MGLEDLRDLAKSLSKARWGMSWLDRRLSSIVSGWPSLEEQDKER